MLESPKGKRDKESVAEVLRSPQAWFGFIYGVALSVSLALLKGDTSMWGLIGTVVMAALAGPLLAVAMMQIKDLATLRACITGALFFSLRTVVMVFFASPLSWLEITTNLLIDGFWGARVGYSYRQSPRKITGGAIIGGITVGTLVFLLIISREPTQWATVMLQSETIKNILPASLTGAYAGSAFGMFLSEWEVFQKRRRLESSNSSLPIPSAGAISFGIIPMYTGMVTYKGTGVVRFGNLELQVNRTQYQDLKLGLTYKIEYHGENRQLLGYELVSKETAVIGEPYKRV